MVKTVFLKTNAEGMDAAAAIIAKAGLVVAPTETAYGICCDATSEKAVKKVFEAKNRPGEKSLPIIACNQAMAEKYCSLNRVARRLVKKFMPGPLSLVVPRKGRRLAKSLSADDTVSFRIPGSAFLRKLVEKTGVPLTATSANASGARTSYEFQQVKQDFEGIVEAIFDAGNLEARKVSTIVSLVQEPRLLREGAVDSKKVFSEISKYMEKGLHE